MPLDPADKALLVRVGRRIAELRERAGLTQDQMAERLDVANWTYRRWEYGQQNTTLVTLARIARALEVDVIDFLKPLGS